MVINGIEYDDKELDFTNILCDMEDAGVDIMSFGTDKIKPFTICRGIISAYTGEKDLKECGKILTEHIKNGGTMDDILNPFTEAMEASGFGKAPAQTTEQATKTQAQLPNKK